MSAVNMTLNENNMTTTSAADDLRAELNTKPVREYLLPLTKALGGIPSETVRARGVSAGHYSSMPRRLLVAALLDCYGTEKVAAAMVALASDKAAPAGAGADAVAQLSAALARLVSSQTAALDVDAVRSLVVEGIESAREGIVAELVSRSVTRYEVLTPAKIVIDCGVQHPLFPTLLSIAGARLPNGRRLNVWLWGPPSTGKTTAGISTAKALGIPFHYTGRIDTAFALMGYIDAHGRPVRTQFREAWEHGGVFLFDECDASDPSAVCALNAAIDGTQAAFPDAMVPRHPDCVILAGANTAGRGGSSKYAGRVRQDDAFLSRWTCLEWPHSDILEDAIAGTDAAGKLAVKIVRAFRAASEQERVEGVGTTTRSSLDLGAMIRGKVPLAPAVEGAIRKGLPADSWARLVASVRVSGIDLEKVAASLG